MLHSPNSHSSSTSQVEIIEPASTNPVDDNHLAFTPRQRQTLRWSKGEIRLLLELFNANQHLTIKNNVGRALMNKNDFFTKVSEALFAHKPSFNRTRAQIAPKLYQIACGLESVRCKEKK